MPETDGKAIPRTDASAPLLVCDANFKEHGAQMDKMSNALFGPDGTDGLVGRYSVLETKLNTIYKIVTFIITPSLFLSVIAQLWVILSK